MHKIDKIFVTIKGADTVTGKTLTIAIPTLNGSQFIEQTILSAWTQLRVFDSVELLIVDNASTDDTPKILSRLKDDGVAFTHVRNRVVLPPGQNYFEAVRNSSGEYVWLLADDDVLNASAVQTMLTVVSKERPAVVVSNFEYVDVDLNILESHPHNLSPAVGEKSTELDFLTLKGPDSFPSIGFKYIGLLSANCVNREGFIAESNQQSIPDGFDFMYTIPAMMLRGNSVFILKSLVKFRQYTKRWQSSADYLDALTIDWLITPVILQKLASRGYPRSTLWRMTFSRSLTFLSHLAHAKSVGTKFTRPFVQRFIKVNKWNILLMAQLPLVLLPTSTLKIFTWVYQSSFGKGLKRLMRIK